MKKLKTKVSSIAAIALTTSALVAGCSSSGGGQTTSKNGGSMTISQYQPFDNVFIPDLSSIAYTGYISAYGFDTLFTEDKNYNLTGDLAQTNYQWSADHKTLTIHLKPNAKWSDGAPITSDDVLLFMDFMASKTYNDTFQGSYESIVDDVQGASQIMSGKKTSFADTGGFEKVNSKTFKIHFDKVNPHEILFNVMFWAPLPSHILKNIPFSQWENMSYDRKPSVVSGMYTFSSVSGTDTVVMKANPYYVFGKPHISTVIWRTVNPDVAPGELQSSQIDYDLNGLQPSDMQNIKQFPNITAYSPTDQGYYYLGLKDNLPIFKDVRVRQALAYAINRQAIIKGVVKGYGTVANGPVTPAQWGVATAKDGMNNYAYNPQTAAKLLDEAGYKKGATGYRVDPKTGQVVSVQLGYPSSDPQRTAAALQVAQDLKAVGIKVVLDAFPKSSTMYTKVQTGDIQMWMGGWLGLGSIPDVRALWGSNQAYNTEFEDWVDPHNDALLAAAYNNASSNTAAWKKALINWQLYVNQQMPVVFLWDDDLMFAINKRVQIPKSDWQPIGPIRGEQWWLQ